MVGEKDSQGEQLKQRKQHSLSPGGAEKFLACWRNQCGYIIVDNKECDTDRHGEIGRSDCSGLSEPW